MTARHTNNPDYTKGLLKVGEKPGAKAVGGRVISATQRINAELQDAEELVASLSPDLVEALNSDKPLKRNGSDETTALAPVLNIHTRHQLIVRLRAQGMHPARIARAVGVTERTVHNVTKDWYKKHEEQIKKQDINQFVLMLADGYLEDIDRLTDVIENSTRGFPAAVVGAIKARQEARQKYIEVLADFGFLKRTPTEVDVTHHGAGNTYQQIVVLSPEEMKAASKAFLAQKRLQLGQEPDEDADDRLSTLVVANDPGT